MTFEELGLCKQVVEAVRNKGYEEPTPIQRETIPYVLKGQDVLGCAQTGTGKTAAFALPILQRLYKTPIRPGKRKEIRCLVLTPTRELAMQIFESFQAYGKGTGIHAAVVFGGVSQRGQEVALARGVDILVATPGRLCDLCGQGIVKLDGIQIFVLDEADRMLDMGFAHDVKKIVKMLPLERQTLFFSATMPKDVEELAISMLKNPASVKVDPVSSTVDAIDQTLYMIDKLNKRKLLYDLLTTPKVENALVFVRTRHGADKVQKDLFKAGVDCRAIHGDKTQASRQEALHAFKAGTIKALIATDIAARGLDIQGLSHVINYDLPNEPEAYVHRIGRTGRAGHTGEAISFCCFDELKSLSAIEKLIGFRIKRLESPYPMEIFTPTEKQPRPPREMPKRITRSGEALKPQAKKPFVKTESGRKDTHGKYGARQKNT